MANVGTPWNTWALAAYDDTGIGAEDRLANTVGSAGLTYVRMNPW